MKKSKFITKLIPGGNSEIYLRNNGFDEDIFRAIMVEQEYDHTNQY